MATLDLAPDLASPPVADLALADLAMADLTRPGMTPRDLATRDLATHDLATRDLATRDLATPHDLALPDLLAAPACQLVMVSTLAGNGVAGFADGSGGPNGTAQLFWPVGVAFDGAGNVIVGDQFNERIRKIAPDGTTTTLAGNGTSGFADGSGASAEFREPVGVAVGGDGTVYVADYNGNRIRKVAPDGTTSTLAGNGTAGFFNGSGGANGTTQFNSPVGLALDGAGTLFVGDSFNRRIRKVAPDGSTTTLTGDGTFGSIDGSGGATEFEVPSGVALGPGGTLYVADPNDNRIRKVAPDGSTTTLAGNGLAGLVDGSGGRNGTAELFEPYGVAADSDGNVYVADFHNNRIRKVSPDGSTITIAGHDSNFYSDGDGCSATFNGPIALALAGKLLIVADEQNNRIRSIRLP
jgi:sugar lactone lactonase YvrE